MLYRIEIENFFSIGERQVIDLRVRKSVQDELGRLSPIYQGSEDRAANVVALFGPNAAGKSNVLRAIAFGVWFVTRSFESRLHQQLPYEKFGTAQKINEPTRLSFSFSAPINFLDTSGEGAECPYKYEAVFSSRGGRLESVMQEKLSYQPRGRGKPTAIFERRRDGCFRYDRSFMSTRLESALKEVLRRETSVVSTLAQLNHEASKNFVTFFEGVVSNIFVDRMVGDEGQTIRWYDSQPAALDRLQAIGRRIDLGIEQISIDNSLAETRMLLKHSGLDQKVTLNRESHGTRQFIGIFPFIHMALERGGTAIIDDLDLAIHPLLLPEVLRWFSDEEHNPLGAQLWMTCHAASLLSDLTKEEVLLCEKNSHGQTAVYKLADVERVRRDENFFGKYLGGEYGAVPIVG